MKVAISILFFIIVLFCFGLIPEPKQASYGSETIKIHKCVIQIKANTGNDKSFEKMYNFHKVWLNPAEKDCVNYTSKQSQYTISISRASQRVSKGKCRNESYTLDISSSGMNIVAECAVGLVRAFSTLDQLVSVRSIKGVQQNDEEVIQEVDKAFEIKGVPIKIADEPRFSYRGLMIDTSRHFLKIATIQRIINAMSLIKLNVLHWHITDDDSFTMQSQEYPGLAENGSFAPNMIYTSAHIRGLVEFARTRGVRIIPEIDMPGHIRSVGKYAPLNDIITCYNSVWPYRVKDVYRIHGGPPSAALDPSMDKTYAFTEKILKDIISVFRDEYVHMGGDEVIWSCWRERKSIEEYMKKHNIPDFHALQTHFVQIVRKQLEALNSTKKGFYWSDPDTFKIKYKAGDILEYWGLSSEIPKLKDLYPENYFVLAPNDYLYLDCGLGSKYGTEAWCGDLKTWLKMYLFEPTNFSLPEKQILGAEACAWGELNNDYNLETRLWPRMAALAETLWLPKRTGEINMTSLVIRLNEFSAKLIERGVPTNAITGQYCEINTHECFQKWPQQENEKNM